MNPFKFKSASDTTMTDHIIEQIKNLSIGESKELNIKSLTPFGARPATKYASEKIGFKLKTKTDNDGNFWVLRVE